MLGGPVVGLIVAAVAVVVVVLAKALFEVTADLVRLQTRFTAQSASMSGRIEMVENQRATTCSRIERAEATAAKQQAFIEKVLDRVRAVETATGNQESINERHPRTGPCGRGRRREPAGIQRRGAGPGAFRGDRRPATRRRSTRRSSNGSAPLSGHWATSPTPAGLADVVAGKTFHDARRLITPDEVSEIIRIGNDVLGFIISESQIRYIERVTLGLELLGTGRLAAHSADAVIRVITSLSRGDRILHAEIGVLSGLYAALLGRIAGDAGVDVHQVLIDPFEGYYGESEFDALTLSTISADTVRRNLRMAGCDEEEYTILEGLSGDPATLQAAGGRRYDTILVDGDHSYEGVTGRHRRLRSAAATRGAAPPRRLRQPRMAGRHTCHRRSGRYRQDRDPRDAEQDRRRTVPPGDSLARRTVSQQRLDHIGRTLLRTTPAVDVDLSGEELGRAIPVVREPGLRLLNRSREFRRRWS